jgi:hypothetical protein
MALLAVGAGGVGGGQERLSPLTVPLEDLDY